MWGKNINDDQNDNKQKKATDYQPITFKNVARRGVEPLLPGWKPGVLTDKRTGQYLKLTTFLQKRRKDRYIPEFSKQFRYIFLINI